MNCTQETAKSQHQLKDRFGKLKKGDKVRFVDGTPTGPSVAAEPVTPLAQRPVTEVSEIEDMIKYLEYRIEPSPECDYIYEKIYDGKDENGAKAKLELILQDICKTGPNKVKDPTPQSLLDLAHKFFFIGDRRVACELIWIGIHEGIIRFAQEISKETGHIMCSFRICHKSFYQNKMDGKEISEALDSLQKFIDMVDGKAKGIPTARKLKMHRQEQRWNDKRYKKTN
uniref:Uncharacterized protein n=1 Tax=Ditylenchus dipsaci TaxID=166011 RepID=A0A915DNX9_9BILA